MIKVLWDNEARLCSFISDIQQRNSGSGTGYSMFFLDTILVPPIKFRPPTKGGDSVSKFTHTFFQLFSEGRSFRREILVYKLVKMDYSRTKRLQCRLLRINFKYDIVFASL